VLDLLRVIPSGGVPGFPACAVPPDDEMWLSRLRGSAGDDGVGLLASGDSACDWVGTFF